MKVAVWAWSLTAAAALVAVAPGWRRAPARQVRRGAFADPTETVQSALAAFDAATTAPEVTAALSKMYDALPRDDFSLQEVVPMTRQFQLEAMQHIADRRDEARLWNADTVEQYKALRNELDPLRSIELKGYLSIAGLIGGALYVAALGVQFALPEIFPAFYLACVAFLCAPFLYAFFLA